MGKYFFIILSLCNINYCLAQGFIKHVVQRGETLEYIAEKYGTTPNAIQEQNEDLDFDLFCVGLPIQIPMSDDIQSAEVSKRIFNVQNANNGMIAEAEQLYSNGQYRKAAKIYSQALKDSPKSDYYYLRGRCYFHQGKYKSALQDLEIAADGDDLSIVLRNSCAEMLASARELREQQLAEREEIWAGIAGTLLTAGSAVLQAKAMTESSSKGYQYTGTSGNAYMSDPNVQAAVGLANSEQRLMQSGVTLSPTVTSTSSSSASSISSSSVSTSSSKRKCSCQGGWYDCCSKVATFGLDTYHECPNCHKKHIMGSHSCQCTKCGGTGYI